MIDRISSVAKIVSSYIRTVNKPDSTTVENIKHVDDRGRITIDVVQYTTYNKQGQLDKPKNISNRIDIRL